MEIGVPIRTYKGSVPLSKAQMSTAAAINAGALVVSEAGLLGTPTVDSSMRKSTQAALMALIPQGLRNRTRQD